MPIYEFHCDACGERFEALVDAGTTGVECRICAAPRTRRVFSAQAAPMKLAKSPGDKRKQERKNAALHARTKADFKARRQRARDVRRGPGQ